MAARRRAASLAVCAALLGGLTACGVGQADQPTPSGSAAEPSATPSDLAQPTDRSPHGVLVSAELTLQAARRAKLSYRISGDAGAAGDSADGILYWAPKTVMQLKRNAPGATDQLIVLDTACYQGGDAATAARLGGPHWEKSGEVTGPDGHREGPYSALADRLNPLAAVAGAAGAADLRLLGEEKLGEESVGHYRATVRVADYAAAPYNQLSPARRQQLAGTLSQGQVDTLTLDLWLNEKDQLVQLHRTGQGGRQDLDDTIEYRDYGGSFSVSAPPENDVKDAPVR